MTHARSTWRRHGPAALALTVVTLVAAACGITDQEQADRMDFDRFGVESSVAVSSTAVASSGAPPVTDPGATAATTDVAAPTTTPRPPEPFTLYFAQGTGVEAVQVGLPADPSLRDVVEGLAAGPPPTAAADGARSLVADGLVRTMTLRDHRLTVDLDDAALGVVDADEQRQLIGQLVLSLGEHPGVGGIDEWTFTIDGRPLSVYRRDGTLTQSGVPVTRSDYDVLVD